ncbi:hypothetical protein Naga_100287g7 [Nannochloropsis gaditana]|uniref:Uncharacterized protein n=1 Tax=Nannochloropsis gaditana TaxID=72520 RepID=W7U9M6_9STRA|nr:hypothetical protein Naga_100287g7 [Nannochloropsis gaditana]
MKVDELINCRIPSTDRSGHLNVEYAGTRPLSEAKRVRVPIVLPWVTRLEGGMSLLFNFYLWGENRFWRRVTSLI